MVQVKERRSKKIRVRETQVPEPVEVLRKRRRTGLFVASGMLAVIALVLGTGYYQKYMAPLRRPVISVDGHTVRMDYFLKRTRLAGGDAMGTLQSLTNEELFKRGGPGYVPAVNAEEISRELRSRASSDGATVTDVEFKEWYRQSLNETGLSDSEYREMVRASLLAERLRTYLEERVPTVGEQVHLNVILVETAADADKAMARLKAGEKFADVARDMSLDPSGEAGGDFGWVPKGIMDPGFDQLVFGLQPGLVAEPVQAAEGFQVFMVSEKDQARQIDNAYMQALKNKVLSTWLSEEVNLHKIEYNFDSEIYAWISAQLEKTK